MMSRRRRRTNQAQTMNGNGNGHQPVQIMEGYQDSSGEVAMLQERLASLEMALESLDWRVLSAQAENEFSRQGLRDITEFSRIMAIKNPLIKRGVTVQRLYVFGQGLEVSARQREIDQVLTAFWDDPANMAELTSHQAMGQKEIELQTDGNLFFVFFTNRITGRVRLRSIPFDEIEDVITDPDDAKTVWFYRRLWSETKTNLTSGSTLTDQQEKYYPDWRYNPRSKPQSIGRIPVVWDQPVMHVRVGGFSNWRFGLSEVYDAIDWAKAYKEFLEDWATIVRAYRKFAFQLTMPGGKSAIAAAKAKLGSTIGNYSGETNPPPVAGSTFIAGEGVNLQPVRTSGATVSADDGRRMMLMVAASKGLPETFYGDASVGTLATAKSLDRPTELMMRDRQMTWEGVLAQIHNYVLAWQVKAPQGALRTLGVVETEWDGDNLTEKVRWDKDVDPRVTIAFPPLVQSDVPAQVTAIVDAATLRGQTLAGTIDARTLAAQLLTTLGVPDVDEVLQGMFDADGQPVAAEVAASESLAKAARELGDILVQMREA